MISLPFLLNWTRLKKSPRPRWADTLQGRERNCFRGTTLVRRPLAGAGLGAAARFGRIQLGAVTGAPVPG